MFETNLDEELRQWRAARGVHPRVSPARGHARRTLRVHGAEVVVITRRSRRIPTYPGGQGSEGECA
jgi:hypothetical protein